MSFALLPTNGKMAVMPPKPFDEVEDAATAIESETRFAPDAAFALVVIAGAGVGTTWALDAAAAPRLLVGKGPSCEVLLDDPAVSRRHAAVELAGAFLRLTDLGSTNGTWVNGVAVVEARLFGGERVRVGNVVLSVERRAPAPGTDAPRQTSFGGVVGASPEMRRLYPLCMRLAAATIPVVIEGETGTGKEALAEAIHSEGPRANGPFVVFDCTAVPSSMMEAELFGHERGAFTGAVQRHAGVFEQAHGGTLLIDEIGDLDLTLQPKLLRAIERGEFRRIGGQQSLRVDVRILAATRRNLDREVELGRFRDDLFHRLAVGRIELPPLRRRRGEIAVLARVFARDLGGDDSAFPPHLLSQWEDHSWPGNVRELRNAVARYLALGEQHASTAAPSSRSLETLAAAEPAEGLAAVVERVIAADMPLARARQQVIDAFEERYLDAILTRYGGVVTHAAKAAGVARRHFQRLRARPR
jgi:DNA-binding NtrC family response regulator